MSSVDMTPWSHTNLIWSPYNIYCSMMHYHDVDSTLPNEKSAQSGFRFNHNQIVSSWILHRKAQFPGVLSLTIKIGVFDYHLGFGTNCTVQSWIGCGHYKFFDLQKSCLPPTFFGSPYHYVPFRVLGNNILEFYFVKTLKMDW